MVVSSGGVGKVAAAVDLSVLFKCVFIFNSTYRTARNVFIRSKQTEYPHKVTYK